MVYPDNSQTGGIFEAMHFGLIVIQGDSFSGSSWGHCLNEIFSLTYIQTPPPLFLKRSFRIRTYPSIEKGSEGISSDSHVSVRMAI